jgi:penicillin-binding protein 1C
MTRLVLLIRRHPRKALVVAVLAGLAVWLRCGSLPPGLLELAAPQTIVVVDRHGERLFEARSPLGERGDTLAVNALPPALVHATIAAEDIRFYRHPGVDPIAIVRALWHDARAGAVVEGGSTISQQVVKMLVARQNGGKPARGWRAKFREAVLALRLEHQLRKQDILALYLNLAPYGNQIAGAQRASHAYFGRDVSALTPAEAAFLAALPQQPTRYNPWRDPSRARARQQRILTTMSARGWLSAPELNAARAERLALSRDTSPLVAPHFVARVIANAAPAGTPKPRRIETTLDAGLQRTVQGIIAAERDSLDAHHAALHDPHPLRVRRAPLPPQPGQ